MQNYLQGIVLLIDNFKTMKYIVISIENSLFKKTKKFSLVKILLMFWLKLEDFGDFAHLANKHQIFN